MVLNLSADFVNFEEVDALGGSEVTNAFSGGVVDDVLVLLWRISRVWVLPIKPEMSKLSIHNVITISHDAIDKVKMCRLHNFNTVVKAGLIRNFMCRNL